MRPKFQLDMATLMLVFTLFWSYTSFSSVHADLDREPAGRDPVLPEAVERARAPVVLVVRVGRR